MRTLRWIVFLAVAAGFFALALRDDVYNATSPYNLPYHTLLRKIYSIGAFAVVGFTFIWAWRPPRRQNVPIATMAIAIFSGGIEIGQAIVGGEEPLWSQIFDVACGALGGAIGGQAAALMSWVRAR